ncbi:retrotransposon hot spot (RHS) protein [Trypanosoma cruzi]|nr:retrotransposon hot spot (RHS) protein [Trypanosoma cruzi]
MTALSQAPNPILGEMAGNFVAASLMDAESHLRVALWEIACSVCVVCCLRGCGRIPLSVGLNWRRWRCVVPPRPLCVIAGSVCVCCVEGRLAVYAHTEPQLLVKAISFQHGFFAVVNCILTMSFVMRVRAGHVFPERWAATTILLRLV